MAGLSLKTILVAEDNADDVALLKRAFLKASLPHQLRFVFSGIEAVDYLEGKGPYKDRATFPFPSVLVLDMTMPQGGGVNVLRWLQSNPFFKELPVVVLTGSDEHERTALELGADEFYVKSAAMADLVRILQNINNSWL